MHALAEVAALGLPDCWIGAGLVRSAVWDHLHGRPPAPTFDDVDVAWFDPARIDPAMDTVVERQLRARTPTLIWSVKNQARMHSQNGDRPYRSTSDAIAHWPETATAVAVRLDGDALDVAAPFGLDDLFALVLRPTPAFSAEKRSIFDERIASKRWRDRWPNLALAS